MIHYHMNKNKYNIDPCLSFSYHLGDIMQLFLSFSGGGARGNTGRRLKLSTAQLHSHHSPCHAPAASHASRLSDTNATHQTAGLNCCVNILLCSLRETPPTNNCYTPVGFGVNIAEVFEWWQVSGARLLYLHCCCSISRICCKLLGGLHVYLG